MSNQQSPPKAIKDLQLPISRVKTIMKSSPQVEAIGQDCLFLVAKATVRILITPDNKYTYVGIIH